LLPAYESASAALGCHFSVSSSAMDHAQDALVIDGFPCLR
jgi:hypothetical protein